MNESDPEPEADLEYDSEPKGKNGFTSEVICPFKRKSNKKESEFDPETESETELEEEREQRDNMADITTMAMEEYNRRM